jgi:ubiquinone/menaquinone biosynthesis C-methylase UbiE
MMNNGVKEAREFWNKTVYITPESVALTTTSLLNMSIDKVKEILATGRNYRYYIFEPKFIEVMRLEQHRGKKVMEIGGGVGYDTITMARSGAEVTTVDIIKDNLEAVKLNAKVNEVKVNTYLSDDDSKLPFEDGTFDVVYSWGVIHHIPNGPEVIKDMIRVLKSGGLISLMVYNEIWAWRHRFTIQDLLSWNSSYKTEGPYTSFYSTIELLKILDALGCKIDYVGVLKDGQYLVVHAIKG